MKVDQATDGLDKVKQVTAGPEKVKQEASDPDKVEQAAARTRFFTILHSLRAYPR